MSSNRHGFSNEEHISNYLNNQKFSNLNENMQDFLCFLFNRQISNHEHIQSDLTQKIEGKNPKPDIWIKIGSEIKFVSVKEGSGNSVHQEPFKDFCNFLKDINVSEETINYLKLYHYGDDTFDGNGEIRLSTPDIKTKYQSKILSVNTELNSPDTLIEILYRVLFAGVFRNPIIVDAIYHGSVDNGVYANREEIIDYLIDNADVSEMSGIRFSELTYQPWTRDQHRTAAHPERRYVMQVKWGSMTNCVNIITRRRNNNGN